MLDEFFQQTVVHHMPILFTVLLVFTPLQSAPLNMAASKTIHVPHLGGIEVGYELSGNAHIASNPTCVLINSMCMTVSLYRPQFECKKLTDVMNLLAVEPLGHGATSCVSEHFTYWDSAIMALQVLDALEIKHFFALGTSQGGWIVARMALLAPERVNPLLEKPCCVANGGRSFLASSLHSVLTRYAS